MINVNWNFGSYLRGTTFLKGRGKNFLNWEIFEGIFEIRIGFGILGLENFSKLMVENFPKLMVENFSNSNIPSQTFPLKHSLSNIPSQKFPIQP